MLYMLSVSYWVERRTPLIHGPWGQRRKRNAPPSFEFVMLPYFFILCLILILFCFIYVLSVFTGFSVITCVEFLFLLWDLLRLCYSVEKDKRQKKKEEISNVNGELFDDSIVSCTVKIGSVKIDENDIEIEQDATQYQMDDDSDSDGNGNKIEYEIEGEGWFKVESGSERSVSNKIEYEPNVEKNQAQYDFGNDINNDNNSNNQAQFDFGQGINDDNNSNRSNNNSNILDDDDFNEEVVLYLPPQ